MNFTQNALTVLERRYLAKENGKVVETVEETKVETPEESK